MTSPPFAATAALVLAAGAGTRMGVPKVLVPGWLAHSVSALRAAACDPVVVVLGAAAEEARNLVPPGVRVVVAENWEQGMAASLRAGLGAVADTDSPAVVITLVDLPGLPAAAVQRVATSGGRAGGGVAGRAALRRATYDGEPGHPVLVGRDHWAPMLDTLDGDSGGARYLASARAELIECGDLWAGADVDRR